jgi:hypothetical protein
MRCCGDRHVLDGLGARSTGGRLYGKPQPSAAQRRHPNKGIQRTCVPHSVVAVCKASFCPPLMLERGPPVSFSGSAECVLTQLGSSVAGGGGGAQERLVEAVLSACSGGGLAEGACELERGMAFGRRRVFVCCGCFERCDRGEQRLPELAFACLCRVEIEGEGVLAGFRAPFERVGEVRACDRSAEHRGAAPSLSGTRVCRRRVRGSAAARVGLFGDLSGLAGFLDW